MYVTHSPGFGIPFSIRLSGVLGSLTVVLGSMFLLLHNDSPVVAKLMDEPVFVTLSDDIVEQPPLGESLVPEPEVEPVPPAKEPELIPEPESEPVIAPKPVPEPAPVIHNPKPKPKPKPRSERKRSETVANPPAKMGVPEGVANVPLGSSANQEPRRISMPNYRVKPKPKTPRTSVLKQEKGTVVVRVLISTSGEVKSAQIVRASPYPALNEEALRAVKRASFKPYTENGQPRESMVDIPIQF